MGLVAPEKTREVARFNIALVVLDDEGLIELESRSLVEKLKSQDLSTSIIQNNQSFNEIANAANLSRVDVCDWTLHVDLRSATNLRSR